MLRLPKHLLIVLLLLVLVFTPSLNGAHSSQAASDSFVMTVTGTGQCTSTFWSVPVSVTYDLPTSATELVVTTVNGTRVGHSTKTWLAGSGTASDSESSHGSYNVTPAYVSVDTFDFSASGTVFSQIAVTVSCSADGVATATATNGVPVAGGPGCFFTDRRVNCRAEDAAQTAAIYCHKNGGVTIFAVNNSVGKFAFTATKAQIDKVPANPDKNTLIKHRMNIFLYRLHGGKMQVNAPNGYVYIWDGC